jgi:hypothetical protein
VPLRQRCNFGSSLGYANRNNPALPLEVGGETSAGGVAVYGCVTCISPVLRVLVQEKAYFPSSRSFANFVSFSGWKVSHITALRGQNEQITKFWPWNV